MSHGNEAPRHIRSLMAGVLPSVAPRLKWDIREIRSQHNPYVDALVQDLNVISGRFASMGALVIFFFFTCLPFWTCILPACLVV